jgi:ribonuclease BN (tRNA processing enzyme)
MDIRILGAHNCESSTTSCVSFLIDKTLAIDAGGLTSHLSLQDQQKLNVILLTHKHYDHIRDVPAIALNLSRCGISINIYTTAPVQAVIETHLLNGTIYPKFQELPAQKPTVILNVLRPYETQLLDGHRVKAIPVNHSDDTVGYEVTDAQGKSVFYTADTGPGLSECWKRISPDVLIIDVTLPNDQEEFAIDTGHLTPKLLEDELISFREIRGYLPQVITAHMDTRLEPKIKEEITVVAGNLNIPVIVANEGMRLSI